MTRAILCAVTWQLLAQSPRTATIHVHGGQPVSTFDAGIALGAGVDGHEEGQVAKMFSPANIAAMRSSGLGSLSYRLRTELACEAWHWNPQGRWSDAKHNQGYWISDAESSKPILVSYGYRLPRRGNTKDEANNDGYSRLDDGDPDTFWKSNPYLHSHAQWVVVDFGHGVPIDTVRVVWGVPFATAFRIEYSTAAEIDITLRAAWRAFPSAVAIKGTGGDQTIALANRPVVVRYMRLLMTDYSGTALAGSSDTRDRMGVAIREIFAGVQTRRGFTDYVRHANNRKQTVVYVSSTDPWHRAEDRDPRVEQPGFDLLFGARLTNLPMLTAVPVLYDVPENAANEIRYLKSHHYPVTHLELGEEPEEQSVSPEDYGELYSTWRKALRDIDPALIIGGPSLVLLHADVTPDPSWTKRLFAWFREHNRLQEFQFFSFEWYPFDNVCAPVGPLLARAHSIFANAIEKLFHDGVPRDLPMFITEYGYSAYGCEAEVSLPGALLNAETVAEFLALGGQRTYLYGYEPNELINEKDCSWGNNMLFLMNEDGAIRYRMPTYYAAQLLTREWTSPAGGMHKLYQADSDTRNVTAFALQRPDGQWSVLLINKDPKKSFDVEVKFDASAPRGLVEVYQYSARQYAWQARGTNGHPVRDLPPVHRKGASGARIEVPAYSVTIVRGPI